MITCEMAFRKYYQSGSLKLIREKCSSTAHANTNVFYCTFRSYGLQNCSEGSQKLFLKGVDGEGVLKYKTGGNIPFSFEVNTLFQIKNRRNLQKNGLINTYRKLQQFVNR